MNDSKVNDYNNSDSSEESVESNEQIIQLNDRIA